MSTTISSADPAYTSMNYSLLREQGLKFIEELASDFWTDYNTHDPGITLLEILCYAITDLGYRTDFSMADLLADTQTQSYGNGFHGITEILPCNPVAHTDLRKMVLDQDGILNAKVSTTTQGLYDIALEFEEDPVLGNLNSNVEETSIDVSGTVYATEVAFSPWDELSGIAAGQTLNSAAMAIYEYDHDHDGDGATDDPVIVAITDAQSQDMSHYYAELIISVTNSDLSTTAITVSSWIKIISEGFDQETDQDLQDAIVAALTNGTVVSAYWDRIQAAITLTDTVSATLHNYRPLCEDFSFKAYRVEEIGIKAHIDLALDADAETVLTEIYYRIHNFLTLSPVFHTYDERVAEGKVTEDIFEGPTLTHGFLDSEALETLRIREEIHVSDLIQLLTDISGLDGVRDFRIANYINNNVFDENVTGSLQLVLPGFYEPLLSPYKSEFTFYENGETITVDTTAAITAFEALKIADQERKTVAGYDIAAPEGQNKEVENYYSLQHHFPAAYGIGEEGLAPSSSDDRKAKARQLQAYLLFFEQVLANGFSQLSHIKALFSTDTSVSNTYFSRELTANDIPGAEDLLDGTYATDLPDMTETTSGTTDAISTYQDRRNRALDHLLARLGEDFSDYAALRYAIDNDMGTVADSLIEDKINVLQQYPDISGNRNRGYNYLSSDVWNTDNVSGLEKRIAALLGITDYQRQYLSGSTAAAVANKVNYYIDVVENTNEGTWYFRDEGYFTDEEPLIRSTAEYDSRAEAREAAKEFIIIGTQLSQYEVDYSPSDPDEIVDIRLVDEEGVVIGTNYIDLASLNTYPDKDSLTFDLVAGFSLENGFHMVEHTFLRPIDDDSVFLSIPTGETGIAVSDPYAFRVSFILPVQNVKFGNRKFRQHTETIIRNETPAHIIPHIHWVRDIDVWCDFEEAYRNWLQAGFDDATTRDALVTELNGLLSAS